MYTALKNDLHMNYIERLQTYSTENNFELGVKDSQQMTGKCKLFYIPSIYIELVCKLHKK